MKMSTNHIMSFIKELESLLERKIIKQEKEWLHQQMKIFDLLFKLPIYYQEIFKILIDYKLIFKESFVSVEEIAHKNIFAKEGIIFGKLVTKSSENHIDSLFLEQNQQTILCEITEFKDYYLNNIVLFLKWKFIPSSNSQYSYLEIDGNSIVNIHGNFQIPRAPKYIYQVNNSPKSGPFHIFGVIEAISPYFLQNNQILFFVEITSGLSRIIVFKGLYYIRNALEVGESCIFTHLLPSKMNDIPIYLNTKETKAILKKDSFFSRKKNQNLISYEGIVTSDNVNSIIQLDNTFYVYFTHYSFHDYGRGIRKGTKIRLYNAHPIKNDNQEIEAFGLCMYSSYKIIEFSDQESLFYPFIHTQKWNHISILECREIIKNTEMIKKKFEISEKRAENLLKKFNFKREHFKRNIQNEFINHEECNVCTDKLKVKSIPPLKDFTNFFSNGNKNLTIKSSHDINMLLIGMIDYDSQGLFIFDQTSKFQLFLVNQTGNFGELDMKWINYKETVYLIEEYIIVQDKDLDYIQADIQSLKILYRYDSMIEVYTPRNIKRFTIEKKGILINNTFNIYCKDNIIIKSKLDYSVGLFYLLKANFEYEFGNLKMFDQKSYELTETSTIKVIKETNDITSCSHLLNSNPKTTSLQFVLIEKSSEYNKETNLRLMARDIESPSIIRIFINNDHMGLIPGSKITLFDLKFNGKENPYLKSNHSQMIVQVDSFPHHLESPITIL